jgi:hypothetical protein
MPPSMTFVPVDDAQAHEALVGEDFSQTDALR